MAKIVYNACFGGFSLSHKAVMRYAEIKGLSIYAFVDERGVDGRLQFGKMKPASTEDAASAFIIHYYTVPDHPDDSYFSDHAIERTDPALIQVVEELGREADGSCAKLKIAEVPSGTLYRIDEYDGSERVMTNDDYDWTVAP